MSNTLSNNNLNSLRHLKDFDEVTIQKIAAETFNSLTDPNYKVNLTEDEISAQVGLATLIAICVRQGSFTDSITSILHDNGLSDSSSQKIAALYKEKADLLRAEMANISISYPRIVGCDWRLDYSVSNSETGSVLLPCFFVKIKLENGGTIDFSCNEEEMTALVAALKDAASEAQRTH